MSGLRIWAIIYTALALGCAFFEAPMVITFGTLVIANIWAAAAEITKAIARAKGQP